MRDSQKHFFKFRNIGPVSLCLVALGMSLFILSKKMSVETWGQLDKSQVDSEKVEAAIARLVAEHEADPDSHLGAGESLEAHRASEIIDHLAGSVPYDKISRFELKYTNFFTSPSTYDFTGNVYQAGDGEIRLADWHVPSGYSQVDIGIPRFQNASFPEKDINMQFCGFFDWSTSADAIHFLIGDDDNGFGFEVDNNVFKARLSVNGTTYYSSAITYDKTKFHIFRIALSVADGYIYFYIDGELVASLVLHPKGAPDFSYLTIFISSTVTTYATMTLSNLEMSYEMDLI